jgi:hypothetical protein
LISPAFLIWAFQLIDRRDKMNAKIDFTDPGGPSIAPSLVLQFLIKRCNEMIQSENPRFPLVLQGLALSALAVDEDLAVRYQDISSSPNRTSVESMQRAIEIFQLALERDADSRSSQYPSGDCEDYPAPDVKFCRQVMMTAVIEGRIIAEQSDYRFVQVFVLLGWVSLQCDAERLTEFEATCHSFADNPEKLLTRGRDVLQDALFLRRAQGQVTNIQATRVGGLCRD